MNPWIQQLVERAENRFSVDRAAMKTTDWVMANTKLAGRPFTVERREFQRRIMDDLHPNLDVIKCSQIGLTEIEIRKVLAFLLRHRRTAAIFTLPNEDMYKRISQTRIKPLLEANPVFNPDVIEKPVRSMGTMQFGESYLYVTDCTEGSATSIPADFVANDEVDLSPQDKLVLFNSRLQNSDYRINQRFSTPSFPSFGIDKGFAGSDQHLYLVRCDACNHWQWPEFDRKFIVIPGLPDYIDDLTHIDKTLVDLIDIEGSHVVCEKCRRALDLGRSDNREWVPRFPGRDHHRGYAVSPFSTDRLDPPYIINQLFRYQANDFIRGFHNTVLGKPYTDGNIQLTVEAIEACFTGNMSGKDIVNSDTHMMIGIDVGAMCHIVVGTLSSPCHVVRFMTCHIEEIDQIISDLRDEYNIVAGAIDRWPYEPTARSLFQQTGGIIVPVEYRGTKEVNVVFTADNIMSHAQVDRTLMIDDIARQVRTGNIKFSGYMQFRSSIVDHLRNMVRREEPELPAVWEKLHGPGTEDHFFHALGFLLVASKIKQIERFKSKDDVRSVAFASTVEIKPFLGQVYKRKEQDANKLLERRVIVR